MQEALNRCNREIDEIRNNPICESSPAYLSTMGVNEWEVEKRLIQAESVPYDAFLKGKIASAQMLGIEVDESLLHPMLKPHQRAAVIWAARGGRRALFEAFGLGKTIQQLEILRAILRQHPDGKALIVAPLGVAQEFAADAAKLGVDIAAIGRDSEANRPSIYLTNYEPVRDGKFDLSRFLVTSLDEAAVLRGFGGTKTFREFMRLFENVRYRFVATATPDPNEYIELLAYAAYLGIMEVSEAKTRFFKRDATKADNLTIAPGKEEEFWLWVSTWALFLQKPSDLGFDDTGYALPPLKIEYHEVRADHETPTFERDGQGKMFRNAGLGVVDAAREKRDSLPARVEKTVAIMDQEPDEHWLLWHDLESERVALERALPGVISVYGAQRASKSEVLEASITGFANGSIKDLAAKPSMFGAGANFQRHCARAIFVGIGFKFHAFIQAIHRIYRFLQTREVVIHLIYSESERDVLRILLEKWERHKEKVEKMSAIIKEYGLSELALAKALSRSIGVERVEVSGEKFRLFQNDCVEESRKLPDNSVGLVLTSIPFSTQYQYSTLVCDFGYNEDNAAFFEQMDYLTPELVRILMPGRIAAIHVKDRTVPGGITGYGFQSAYPFHCDCIKHYQKHGLVYMGMKTVVTDVVRENNQTYRLGWTEQCKDGTKMGCGMPEYLLLFRKVQTDTSRGYADLPVVKSKVRYSKARWQVDAHGFTRSSGDRHLKPEEIENLPHRLIFGMFHDFSLATVYDFEHHVKLGDALEARGRLPVTFMLLQPPSWHPDVWTDITRMLTLNAIQSQKGRQMHLCPMQLDLADRVIMQMSNEGEVVYDPFAGLGTVPARAVARGRIGWGCELNPGYFADAVAYCAAAEKKLATPGLFDLLEREEADAALEVEPAPEPAPKKRRAVK